jgi:hypothetical protein
MIGVIVEIAAWRVTEQPVARSRAPARRNALSAESPIISRDSNRASREELDLDPPLRGPPVENLELFEKREVSLPVVALLRAGAPLDADRRPS